MVESVSRELILPALRLDVPPRPTGQQLAALAERSADQWSLGARDWATQQVVRLAVAEVLRARLAQVGPGRRETTALPDDPEQVTVTQLAALFRPHVGLAGQAFELAVIEAVNAGVPAALDPLREGLRRLGVTGRDRVKVVALGLEKVPERARSEFWEGVKGSSALTAVVDAVAATTASTGGPTTGADRDVSGLDRSQLARADVLVLAGGRMIPATFGRPRPEPGGVWLHVPLALTRHRSSTPERPGGRRPSERVVEVSLRGEHWLEVVEVALGAVAAAMREIDHGGRPRGRTGSVSGLAEAVAQRLVAARDRTVGEVCASLRGIDSFALELFDHQVTTAAVPVAVPVVEEGLFVQLWLPTSALAGPLFTAAPDLFLGAGAEHRTHGGKVPTSASGERPGGKGGRPGRQARPEADGAASAGQSRRGGRQRAGSGRPVSPSTEQVGQQPRELPVAQPAEHQPVAQPAEHQPVEQSVEQQPSEQQADANG